MAQAWINKGANQYYWSQIYPLEQNNITINFEIATANLEIKNKQTENTQLEINIVQLDCSLEMRQEVLNNLKETYTSQIERKLFDM